MSEEEKSKATEKKEAVPEKEETIISEKKETITPETQETITIKKETLWKTSTFVLLAIVVVLAVFLIMSNGNPTGGAVGIPSNPSPSPSAGGVQGGGGAVSATVGNAAILGDENAPITIIEYSDFQCPFCARFQSQTLPQLKSEYIDSGIVNLAYKHFPLDSIHPNARPAAIASECVRDQGGDEAFFEYHDLIFDNQQSLSEPNLKKWAQDLGFNIDSCLDSREFESQVSSDLSEATAAGGRGTPYFVILNNENGQGTPLSGAQPFSAFQQIIEAQLNA